MKILTIKLKKDMWIRFGSTFDADLAKTSPNTFGGGEPAVFVPKGTNIHKFQTEYHTSQYERNNLDFITLLKQFSDNVICKTQPGSWENITLEEKYPQYKNAIMWNDIPYTDDWKSSSEDLGDMHF